MCRIPPISSHIFPIGANEWHVGPESCAHWVCLFCQMKWKISGTHHFQTPCYDAPGRWDKNFVSRDWNSNLDGQRIISCEVHPWQVDCGVFVGSWEGVRVHSQLASLRPRSVSCSSFSFRPRSQEGTRS